MIKKTLRCLTILTAAAMLLSSCAAPGSSENKSSALTWGTWGGNGRFEKFLTLLDETYPDIDLDFISYTGGNMTGYSWAQMRADDIPDIFITSQILDEALAKERLADLSGYPFVGDLSTALLDQVSIDGGVYLLPTSNAMYGIYYNKTLMEEHGWELPADFRELEALCKEIREAGLLPGVVGTHLTGSPFSAVFNLAKTAWLTTPEGMNWERDFLAGNATARGMWESTMEYVQSYIDIGMFHTDPEDRNSPQLILDYLGNRKAVFCTTVQLVNITEFPETGDKLGMMPYIGQDGSKNVYMYNPTYYFGISNRLTRPGNEEKLEKAIKLLSLLFSPKGQATFISESTPCVTSVLGSMEIPENALVYDAQQAMSQGRVFKMTYAHWEHILSDIGQAYKEWFRGENGMDGEKCIARMDELQQNWLDNSQESNFCQSTADFTLEQTARLVGKALGAAAGTDAVMVPIGAFQEDGTELLSGITGKLYAGPINTEVAATICPGVDGSYCVMYMTGAQAKELAGAGFDAAGSGNPFPYLLVTRGDKELEDDVSYQVAFLAQGYTRETAEAYGAETREASLKSILREWLEKEKTVSPEGNPWE